MRRFRIENCVSITDSSVTCAINEETITKLKRTFVLIPKTIPGQQAPGPRGFRRRGPFRAARVLARRAPFLASPITGDTKSYSTSGKLLVMGGRLRIVEGSEGDLRREVSLTV